MDITKKSVANMKGIKEMILPSSVPAKVTKTKKMCSEEFAGLIGHCIYLLIFDYHSSRYNN